MALPRPRTRPALQIGVVSGNAQVAAAVREASLRAGRFQPLLFARSVTEVGPGRPEMDIYIVDCTSAEEMADAAEHLPAGSAVILIAEPEIAGEFSFSALNVAGLLCPPVDADQIEAGLRAVAQGLVVLGPEYAGTVESALAGREAAGLEAEADPGLTEREREVFELLSRGYQNHFIAHLLGISENTVKFHVASIYAKLEVSTRAEAVRVGVRNGLLAL